VKEKSNFWPEKIENETLYSEQDVRKCAKDLCIILQSANNNKLQAVKRKFA